MSAPKIFLDEPSPAHKDCGVRALQPRSVFALLLMALGLCGFQTGCSFLKPVPRNEGYFVLTPMAADAQARAGSGELALGLGRVKFPAYLLNSALVIRRGTHEVEYLDSARWAERLDLGFERVLAANLESMLPGHHVYLGTWAPGGVIVALFVTVERFDVNAAGQGILVARWRVEPGAGAGERGARSGTAQLSRDGPSPEAGAAGVVATMSELAADLSRELVKVLNATSSADGSGTR